MATVYSRGPPSSGLAWGLLFGGSASAGTVLVWLRVQGLVCLQSAAAMRCGRNLPDTLKETATSTPVHAELARQGIEHPKTLNPKILKHESPKTRPLSLWQVSKPLQHSEKAAVVILSATLASLNNYVNLPKPTFL